MGETEATMNIHRVGAIEIKDLTPQALLWAHNNSTQTALQKAVLTFGHGLGLSPAPCSGAMTDFGDRKVTPGIPGYTGENRPENKLS